MNSIIKSILIAILLITEQLHGAIAASDKDIPVIGSAAGSVAAGTASSSQPTIAAQDHHFYFAAYNSVLCADRSALKLLNTKAHMGNPLAQAYLAVLHMSGSVLKQDMKSAVLYTTKCCEWIMKEASRHNPYARSILGHMCLNSIIEPMQHEGTYDSDHAAAEWFKKAAAQGHPEARYILAHMHIYGIGVAQDVGEVAKLLTGSVSVRFLPLAIRKVLWARRPAVSFPSYDVVGALGDPISEGLVWLMKTERHGEAIRMLWESPLPADRDAARPYLIYSMQTEENPEAARMLWASPEKSDRASVRTYIMAMLEDPIFRVQSKGIEMLLSSPEAVDIAAARLAMQGIVAGPMDSDQWLWIADLLASKNPTYVGEALKALASVMGHGRSLQNEITTNIRKIAEDFAHPRRLDASRILGAISDITPVVAPEGVASSSTVSAPIPKKKAKKKPAKPAAPTKEEIEAAKAAALALEAEEEEAEKAKTQRQAAEAEKKKVEKEAKAKKAAEKAEAARIAAEAEAQEAEAKKQEEARKLAAAKAAQEAAAAMATEQARKNAAEVAAKEQARKATAAAEEAAQAAAAKTPPVAAPAPAVATVTSPIIIPGTTLTSPSGNYEVEFLKGETAAIRTNCTQEVFFISLCELLGDGELSIGETLASRKAYMSPEFQDRQTLLDEVVVQTITQARQAIRHHIGPMHGK